MLLNVADIHFAVSKAKNLNIYLFLFFVSCLCYSCWTRSISSCFYRVPCQNSISSLIYLVSVQRSWSIKWNYGSNGPTVQLLFSLWFILCLEIFPPSFYIEIPTAFVCLQLLKRSPDYCWSCWSLIASLVAFVISMNWIYLNGNGRKDDSRWKKSEFKQLIVLLLLRSFSSPKSLHDIVLIIQFSFI